MMVLIVVQVMVQANNLAFYNLSPILPSSLAPFLLPPPLMSFSTQHDAIPHVPMRISDEENEILKKCLLQCKEDLIKYEDFECFIKCLRERGYFNKHIP